MRGLIRLVMAVGAASLVACGGGPDVVRVVDGRLVGGAYVEPEAYASFLRGAISEERGELPAALAAYRETADRDPSDPEVWTRIGEVKCRVRPSDGEADQAFSRAFALEPAYSPAWQARARCLRRRDPTGFAAQMLDATRRAAASDALAVWPQIQLSAMDTGVIAARERLMGLTLAHRESVAAWDALASWALSHGDVTLAARALGEAAKRAPSRRRELGARAEELAGEGHLLPARALAAAVLDADGPELSPLAARLAIDESIASGDLERTRLRAVRAHVGLDEAAGRALLMGARSLARELATPLAAADPGALGARAVLAAIAYSAGDARALGAVFTGARPPAFPVTFVALAPLLELVADVAGAAAAHDWAQGIELGPIAPGDALSARVAVDLAARDVLDEGALPLDARIELAARRRKEPKAPGPTDVDPRHMLLALALLHPTSPDTLTLARHLAPAAAHDGLIATALARIGLARGAPLDPPGSATLGDLDPNDALAAAAALDVAKIRGDTKAIVPARARLTAIARTPAERALARE